MCPLPFKWFSAALIVTLLVCTGAQAADDPPQLALHLCAFCHGADGNSESPLFPRLAGQKVNYLILQLEQLRAQKRSDQAAHDYMWGIAGRLDDATIKGLAAYFAAQKPLPNQQPIDTALIAAGRTLYKEGNPPRGTPPCMACHGINGEGSETAPRLAGQHSAYLYRQLHVFETKQRPSAEIMQAIVPTLSEAEIQALADYLQSLN